jgi:TPR repeat protein
MAREKWTTEELRGVRARAARDDADAQALLGALYASGSLGKRNRQAAFRWYAKAARAGHPDAQYNLGLMHLLGEGTKKDVATALRLLKDSAAKGYDVAQEALGQLYEAGAHGVRKNTSAASRWYAAASALGNQRAKFCLGMMYLSRPGSSAQRKGLRLITEAARAGVVDAKRFLRSARTGNGPGPGTANKRLN